MCFLAPSRRHRCPGKQRFRTIFISAPMPPLKKTQNFIFIFVYSTQFSATIPPFLWRRRLEGTPFQEHAPSLPMVGSKKLRQGHCNPLFLIWGMGLYNRSKEYVFRVSVSVATPARPCSETKRFLVHILGSETLLENAVEKFQAG